MNEKQRKRLDMALDNINFAIGIVSSVFDEENEKLSNYPEQLQCTEQYGAMEEGADHLSEAVDCLETAVSEIKASTER